MKTNTRFWFSPLLLGLVFAMLSLGGCDGNDGAPGLDGADGAPGADGADAIILADVVPINPILDLSNTISYDQVSGQVTIHFFLTDEDGIGMDVTQGGYMDDGWELRVYVAELIDNNDGTVGQSWTPLWNERGYPGAVDPADHLPGTLTLIDAATGEYTYVPNNVLALSSNVQRVIMRARWRETIGGVRYVFANSVNAHYDFLQSDPANELASSGADMVLTANCETCHGARIGDVGHGGGYTQVTTCNNCHNVNYMASRNGGEGDLAFMIHTIHSAGVFTQIIDDHVDPPVPYDFSHVTYPQHTNTCAKCHGGAPEGDLSTLVPTRANCGSCHSDVDFATGLNHEGGIQTDDTLCYNSCHKPGQVIAGFNLDPDYIHNKPASLANTPEYAVNISMTPPANGTHYVVGVDLPPQVTVTLTSNDTPAVTATYLNQADPRLAGATDGVLEAANLYVYGPRSEAVPVLTTNSTTDPALVGTPRQGHPMFQNVWTEDIGDGVGDDDGNCESGENCSLIVNPDGQVTTADATGFKYQLMDNLAALEPGTYMVRFEAEDYGAFSDVDYRTASSAVINFQVGTATEQHKVAGDACTNCHGDTIMHLEGAHPHHQPFDTDGCLGCHDKSGNYGDYIGNRVHAVHSASTTGDLFAFGPRDWSHVTFPQDVNNCTICHTDTATDTPVWRTPDEVACGGCHGADPDVVPSDWPNVDPNRIIKEAAAAQHMAEMGGDFNPTTPPTLQCLVCHGEDRIADLYDTHHLILFPPPVVPEP